MMKPVVKPFSPGALADDVVEREGVARLEDGAVDQLGGPTDVDVAVLGVGVVRRERGDPLLDPERLGVGGGELGLGDRRLDLHLAVVAVAGDQLEEGAADVVRVVGDAGLGRHHLRLAVDELDGGVDGRVLLADARRRRAWSACRRRGRARAPRPRPSCRAPGEKSRGWSSTGESPKTSVTGPDMAGLAKVSSAFWTSASSTSGWTTTVSSSATSSSSDEVGVEQRRRGSSSGSKPLPGAGSVVTIRPRLKATPPSVAAVPTSSARSSSAASKRRLVDRRRRGPGRRRRSSSPRGGRATSCSPPPACATVAATSTARPASAGSTVAVCPSTLTGIGRSTRSASPAVSAVLGLAPGSCRRSRPRRRWCRAAPCRRPRSTPRRTRPPTRSSRPPRSRTTTLPPADSRAVALGGLRHAVILGSVGSAPTRAGQRGESRRRAAPCRTRARRTPASPG